MPVHSSSPSSPAGWARCRRDDDAARADGAGGSAQRENAGMFGDLVDRLADRRYAMFRELALEDARDRRRRCRRESRGSSRSTGRCRSAPHTSRASKRSWRDPRASCTAAAMPAGPQPMTAQSAIMPTGAGEEGEPSGREWRLRPRAKAALPHADPVKMSPSRRRR